MSLKMSVFRLRNVNIVGFNYLFNCDTCFGHTTIFMHTYVILLPFEGFGSGICCAVSFLSF
jgi:hypothetical protein